MKTFWVLLALAFLMSCSVTKTGLKSSSGQLNVAQENPGKPATNHKIDNLRLQSQDAIAANSQVALFGNIRTHHIPLSINSFKIRPKAAFFAEHLSANLNHRMTGVQKIIVSKAEAGVSRRTPYYGLILGIGLFVFIIGAVYLFNGAIKAGLIWMGIGFLLIFLIVKFGHSGY